MLKNKFFRVLRNLFFVPRCASCGELLSAFYEEKIPFEEMLASDCLCEKCKSAWDISLLSSCPDCKVETSRCLCAPKGFSKMAQKNGKCIVDALPKLTRYDPKVTSVANRVIYSIKHTDDTRYFEFLAYSVAQPLGFLLSLERIDPEDCVFTFIPRSGKAKAKDGFDQSKRLCRELAKVCGGAYERSFFRVGSREQKRLGAAERRENIKRSIRLVHRAEKKFKGKNVVIIDDLVTTGATLGISSQMLSELGARKVMCVCIARSK